VSINNEFNPESQASLDISKKLLSEIVGSVGSYKKYSESLRKLEID
jgi:hypothetical protein